MIVRVDVPRTITALASTIVAERCDPAGTHVPRVAMFVAAQVRRMPDHLRSPLRLATLVFASFAFLHAGRPFHLASDVQRRRQVGWWRRCPGPPRDLIRFYENLIVYGWFASEEEHAS